MSCDGDGSGDGRFVVVEGIEGAGKTTHIQAVAHAIRARGREVVTTREPGGTALGEGIRRVLMRAYDPAIPAMSELLLIFAARAAHLAQVIEPALARGAWVICDRFTDASYAYQGAARGLGAPAVAALETLVQGQRRPDAVLLFDLPVADGLARAGGRGRTNRFDRETRAFHERVRAAYLERAAADRRRYRIIDAAQPQARVRAAATAAVTDWL